MTYRYDHYFDFSRVPNFSEMNEVFARIFDRSVKYYLKNRDGYEQNFALSKIVEYVRDLEKSLLGLINLGYVTTSNLQLVKDTYKNLDTIGLLNSSFKGRIYGVTSGGRIEINPYLRNSYHLTGEERTLLYVCHEIGHRFHTNWVKPTNLNSILENKDVQELYRQLPPQSQSFIYSGLSLLDEALTQDRAEEITYYFAGKKRPEMTPRRSSLFDGGIFKTNFDYYGELHEPAIRFGKTLRGISRNPKETLKTLGRAAIDDRFTKKIENEYRSKGSLLDLFALIHSMGVIKEATYEVFGMGLGNALPRSKQSLELLIKLTDKHESSKQLDLKKQFKKIEQ